MNRSLEDILGLDDSFTKSFLVHSIPGRAYRTEIFIKMKSLHDIWFGNPAQINVSVLMVLRIIFEIFFYWDRNFVKICGRVACNGDDLSCRLVSC